MEPSVSSVPSAGSDALEEKIQRLDKRIASLEKKGKDGWDKFQIVAALLIPASIALAGYYYSNSIKEAEIESGQRVAEQQLATSRLSAKVGQAQLISSFMDALISENSQKQQLAIEAILLALPDEGPKLVSVVSQTSQNKDLRLFARTSLDQRRTDLIKDAFADDKARRISATQELARGWHSDPGIVGALLEMANTNPDNLDGVVNTLVLFEIIDRPILLNNEKAVQEFLRKARLNGQVSEMHAKRVESRFREPG
jgi:hypothetical protein